MTGLDAVLKKIGDNAFVLANLAHISKDRLKDYNRAAGYVDRMLALRGTERKSLETALAMKQELRRLQNAQDVRYSDEKIRTMAENSPAPASSGSQQASESADAETSELRRLEDSIK